MLQWFQFVKSLADNKKGIFNMRRLIAAILSAGMVLLCACSVRQEPTASASAAEPGYNITFADSLDHTITLNAPPQRVAVLLGSYAEVWLQAGGGESLVAVTQDAFDERGLELGEAVSNLGQSHEPNLEALLAVQPDLVILTPDLDGQLALKDSLTAAGIPTAWFKVETYKDYLNMLSLFAQLTGDQESFEKYGKPVVDSVTQTIYHVPEGEAPTVLLLRAYSSNVKAKNSDNTAGVMLRDLGCVNIADSDSGLLEDLQMEAILTADPEHIFVVTMGSNTEKALDNLEKLFQSDPAWQSLTAIREGNVHVLDKELFHYKPNARWGESYEILFDILYPQA